MDSQCRDRSAGTLKCRQSTRKRVPLPAFRSSVADAKSLPHLTTQDPQAQVLHYTEDVSTSKDPTHTAGAKCGNCKLYHGNTDEPFGPCQLYPGKAVSTNG
jgi:hypothetical protein